MDGALGVDECFGGKVVETSLTLSVPQGASVFLVIVTQVVSLSLLKFTSLPSLASFLASSMMWVNLAKLQSVRMGLYHIGRSLNLTFGVLLLSVAVPFSPMYLLVISTNIY